MKGGQGAETAWALRAAAPATEPAGEKAARASGRPRRFWSAVFGRSVSWLCTQRA